MTFLPSLLSTETGRFNPLGKDLCETTPLDEHDTLDDGTWRRGSSREVTRR